MRLANYIVRRLLFAIPTLLGLSLIIFYITTFFSPQQRANLFLSESRYQNPWGPDPLPELIEKYHLNDSFLIQYTTWLREVLKGNFGYSFLYSNTAVNVISRVFPATLELIIFAAPITIFGGYKLGVFSAKRAHRKAPSGDTVDYVARTISTVGYSLPSFVLGLLLLVIFYLVLGWFQPGRLNPDLQTVVSSPASGWVSYTGLLTIDGLLNRRPDVTLDALRHLVLPVVTLVTQNLAILTRITRSSMVGELFKPYIVAAKAKGLDERRIVEHAKKNSLISVFTVSGILFASMLTGVVVTEYVFSIQGMGSLLVQAASRLDFVLLVDVSLFFCVLFMLFSLIVDITYAYIDPRVKP